MKIQTHKGWLRLGSNGEEDDILYLRDCGHIEPLAEELKYLQRKAVTVRYWISEVRMTKEDAQVELVKVLLGSVHSKYRMNYSEFTGYLWTDEELNIGGHDLLEELKSYTGSYLILEVEYEG